eukprot:m.143264 g.143264  ORF g.143264 m.143264 type:complete len:227 (+) comp10048_c0_seq8:46-726(+)
MSTATLTGPTSRPLPTASKEEWDRRAEQRLGLNMHLQNEFVFALFRSAESVPPPQPRKPPYSTTRKTGTAPRAHKRTARAARVQTGFEVDKPAMFAEMPESAEMQDQRMRIMAAAEFGGSWLPLALSSLRARIYIMASEAGLRDANQGVVELVQHAVKIYLKALIEETMSIRNEHNTEGGFRHGFRGKGEPLSLKDLHLAVRLRPHLLAASLVTSRERLSSALTMC